MLKFRELEEKYYEEYEYRGETRPTNYHDGKCCENCLYFHSFYDSSETFNGICEKFMYIINAHKLCNDFEKWKYETVYEDSNCYRCGTKRYIFTYTSGIHEKNILLCPKCDDENDWQRG